MRIDATLTTKLLNLSFETCAPAWIRLVGLAEEVSVVVALGFIASVLRMLSQCLVSGVQTGWQFSS